MNALAQFFISIALGIQTLIGGFFPPQQPPQTPSVQQTTTDQSAPMNVTSATSSSAGTYSMADLERFRLSGAAKQCGEPNPRGVPTRMYVGDHKYVQIEEDLATSSVSGEYVSVQGSVVYDGTQTYSWYIDPDKGRVTAVTRSVGTIPFFDTPKDITCVDWNVDESVFALPSGVKITDLAVPTQQQSSPLERDSIKEAQKTLTPNDPVLKAVLLFVQKVQASPRTDIPDLRAFVSKWGPAIDAWNSLAQELNGVSVDNLSPADLDALSARVDKIQSEKIQILAAYNVLSQDEISILDK
jgi:hypothetical protein